MYPAVIIESTIRLSRDNLLNVIGLGPLPSLLLSSWYLPRLSFEDYAWINLIQDGVLYRNIVRVQVYSSKYLKNLLSLVKYFLTEIYLSMMSVAVVSYVDILSRSLQQYHLEPIQSGCSDDEHCRLFSEVYLQVNPSCLM